MMASELSRALHLVGDARALQRKEEPDVHGGDGEGLAAGLGEPDGGHVANVARRHFLHEALSRGIGGDARRRRLAKREFHRVDDFLGIHAVGHGDRDEVAVELGADVDG